MSSGWHKMSTRTLGDLAYPLQYLQYIPVLAVKGINRQDGGNILKTYCSL